MIQTTLSRNGYKIKKSELTTQLLKEIKTELTVNPFVAGDFGNISEKKFSLFFFSIIIFFSSIVIYLYAIIILIVINNI